MRKTVDMFQEHALDGDDTYGDPLPELNVCRKTEKKMKMKTHSKELFVEVQLTRCNKQL